MPHAEHESTVAIVIPLHDEVASVDALVDRLAAALPALGAKALAVFVDDGSRDTTFARLQSACVRLPAHVALVELSRNFGKEAALLAGIDVALDRQASAIVLMDGDLQHPPELLPDMVAQWRAGADTVVARASGARTASSARRAFTTMFYRLLNATSRVAIPDGEGDFRLLDRRVAAALAELRETQRFTKGLYAWVGFRKSHIAFDPPPRSEGGSRFSGPRLLALAVDAITSFTVAPLRLALFAGLLIGGSALAYAAWIVASTLFYGRDVPGFASILTAVLFLGGLQLVCTGLLGEYLGRLYGEAKRRPVYIVRRVEERGG